jgi:hypothetical protein
MSIYLDRTYYKATDVEDLLKIADFGSDYIPGSTDSSTAIPEAEESLPEKLVKTSNVLGIERNDIINQV